MAEEKRLSHRDVALVQILERLTKQVEQQNIHVEDMEKRQLEMLTALETVRFQLGVRQDETDETLDRMEKNILRYRSDMLRLVSEQVRIDSGVSDVASRQATIVRAQEDIARDLADLDARYDKQEKTAREQLSRSVSQQEVLSKELLNLNNHVTKLHMDTEKHLTEEQRETKKRIDELGRETQRRLRAFDEIDSALNTLLSRTEPPPPKELPKAIRALILGAGYVRGKLAQLFRKVSGWVRK